MRILYICHRIPYPPDKGDKIRVFHQLRALAARHEVDLFTLADQAEDMAHRSALLQYCRTVTVARIVPIVARLRALPALLGSSPLTVPYFHSAELARAVRQALKQNSYDRIFVSCSAMAQYTEGIPDIPVLMDLVDVDSDKWTQYAGFARFPFSAIYRREGRCLREYERKVCERVSCVLVTTEREASLVREISASAEVRVVPNGVDIDFFNPAALPAAMGRPTVTFTGDMSYFPNQDAVEFFARKVLPLIRSSVPEVRFLIVGRKPSQNVQRLQDIEGVEVTGFVPDVRTYLAQTHVAVAPFSIAAGIQNKILEAMAFCLPVVATSKTARGLSAGAAAVVETGHTAEELAAKVVCLLRDPELARQKGLEGRRQVAAEYSWDTCLEQLLQLVENPSASYLADKKAHTSVLSGPTSSYTGT